MWKIAYLLLLLLNSFPFNPFVFTLSLRVSLQITLERKGLEVQSVNQAGVFIQKKNTLKL